VWPVDQVFLAHDLKGTYNTTPTTVCFSDILFLYSNNINVFLSIARGGVPGYVIIFLVNLFIILSNKASQCSQSYKETKLFFIVVEKFENVKMK